MSEGICDGCGEKRLLNAQGLLRKHNNRVQGPKSQSIIKDGRCVGHMLAPIPCEGSGKPPRKE